MILRSRSLDLSASWSPPAIAELGRGLAGERLLLDGSASDERTWHRNGLVALESRCLLRLEARDSAAIGPALRRIDAELAARRHPHADGRTGIAVLLSYEALEAGPGKPEETFPALVVLAVDRSIQREADARWCLTAREETADRAETVLDTWAARLLGEPADLAARRPARIVAAPTTSLPRPRYLDAVGRLQRWIAEGHLYQGNLCQRFEAAWNGDALAYHARLAQAVPAPRSAFLSIDGRSLASVSPETFVRIESGTIETLPIKGTRPRHADPETDRRAIESLLDSPKDRAELLMIVDLERNDLGRLCRPGTVKVPELAALRSYATVHHMVARVCGELREQMAWSEMIAAMFPGGSITGAPKESAMDRLRRLEPVSRGPFTGSLFWCGDDGRIDSSILIRTAVFGEQTVQIGAGGGIVADSDPLSEWAESNHKARALTEALGFAPEEAG